MIRRFQKKPVVIEAIQWNGTITADANELLRGSDSRTEFIFNTSGQLLIRTLEGDMRCNVGDWIIKGVKGELYPCAPDIFEETYFEVQ